MRKLYLFTGICICILFTNCNNSSYQVREAAFVDTTTIADPFSSSYEITEDILQNTPTPEDRKFAKSADIKFKVENVHEATEKIEDLTTKYGGYITSSEIRNNKWELQSNNISKDSIQTFEEFSIMSKIQLRVPNDSLDSFVRELNPLVQFLDYRIVNLSDLTLQFVDNQLKLKRLKKYEGEQKLKRGDSTNIQQQSITAEESLLDKQIKQDQAQLNLYAVEDLIKYCNITIDIYQNSFVVSKVVARTDKHYDYKPNFFARVWDSIIVGWSILEEVIVFLFKTWGIIALVVGLVFGIKYLSKLFKKIK